MSKQYIKPFAPGFQTEKEWNTYADQTDVLLVNSGEKPFLGRGNNTYEEIIDAKGNRHIVPKTRHVDSSVVAAKVAAIHREADRTAEDKSTAAEARWFGFRKVAVGEEPLHLIEETGEYVKLLPPAVSSVVHVDFVQNQPQPEQAAAQEQNIAS
jgi:hypothetical protein